MRKGYEKKTKHQAGSKAVQAQSNKIGSDEERIEYKVLSLRMSPAERENLDQLSLKIKNHGYGYSASNTLRVALRILNDVDELTLLKACEELKSEDRRRK